MAATGRRAAPLAVCALAVGLTAAACGSSGRELAEVPEGVTAPPRSTSSTAAPTVVPVALTLTTDGWSPGGTVPVAHGCDDAGTSPALRWAGVPLGTTELALVVTDPDAEGFVHWIVTGLAPLDGAVAAGAVPEGGTELTNSGGGTSWFPLCPPPGEVHTYTFTLLAYGAAPTIPPGGGPVDVVATLEAQASTRSVVTGTFER